MPIQFRCTHCRKPLSISNKKAGTVVQCPKCRQPLTVPASAPPIQQSQPLPADPPAENSRRQAMLLLGGMAAGVILLAGVAAMILIAAAVSDNSQPDNASVAKANPGNDPVQPPAQPSSTGKTKQKPVPRPQPKSPPPVKKPDPASEAPSTEPPAKKKTGGGRVLTPDKLGKQTGNELPGKGKPSSSDSDLITELPQPDKAKKDSSKHKEPSSGKRLVVSLDEFGNPVGHNLSLAFDGEFKGKRILIWCNSKKQMEHFFAPAQNPLWEMLRSKGFIVDTRSGRFQRQWLDKADQFWLFSMSFVRGAVNSADYKAIEKFVKDGKGLYLLADNFPFNYEADILARRIIGSPISGIYEGRKTAYIRNRGLSPSQLDRYGGDYGAGDHALLTDVNFIYEGTTVSHFQETSKVDVVLPASNGKPLVGVSRVPGQRVVIDCGWTRYCYGNKDNVTRTAGTLRFGVNVAAYLMGKDKRGD